MKRRWVNHLRACWEKAKTLETTHGRMVEMEMRYNQQTLKYSDGYLFKIMSTGCLGVDDVSDTIISANGSYIIDIDADANQSDRVFQITKDGRTVTLFTVHEDKSVEFGNGVLIGATGALTIPAALTLIDDAFPHAKTSLKSADDHTQYYNSTRHTKAVHDALDIDADTLDGLDSAAFAVAAKGVTNGDSHDHIGGDGAQVLTSLPVGAFLMYSGTGIYLPATRTEKCGGNASDSAQIIADFLKMAGDWYVCNGQSLTPNLINKFIRSESASGNTGGKDTHTLITAEIPVHAHVLVPSGNAGSQTGTPYTLPVQGGGSATPQSTQTTGGGAAHENKPVYYSLIFIIRMA